MHLDPRADLTSCAGPPTATRRQFLSISFAGMAGIAAILGAGFPPAVQAQNREITLLSPTHFVPSSDKKLTELAQRFTKETGIKVLVEHITNPQLPAKLAAEAQMQAGHDLVDLRMHL